MSEIDQQKEDVSPEKRDVSRQTLMVLVVLAVVVSLLGTFTVLKETSGVHKVVYANNQPAATQSASGTVSIVIADPNAPPALRADMATGRVVLEIVPRS